MHEAREGLRVRKAELSDMERVYALSNDPVVRSVSFRDRPIEWTEHVAWYTQSIADPGLVFLLGFLQHPAGADAGFVGQVRFRKKSAERAEISISVSPLYRCRGMGHQLMERALAWLQAEGGVKCVTAWVKESNASSRGFFSACGFHEVGRCRPEGGPDDALEFEKSL